MRLLAIDCGNTRLKWGLLEKGEWMRSGAFSNDLPDEISSLNEFHADRIIGCCVAGERVRTGIEQRLQDIFWIFSRPECCGLKNAYKVPEELGADRFAALVAARNRLPGGGIVAGFGTAATIDLLDENGRFEGGFIAPGLTLMVESLRSGTNLDPGMADFSICPKSTNEAVRSGAILALASSVEKMAQLRHAPLCLLFGGDAAKIAPHINAKTVIVDNLVLEGLSIIARDLWKL